MNCRISSAYVQARQASVITGVMADGGADKKEIHVLQALMLTNGFNLQDIELVSAELKVAKIYLRQLPTDFKEKKMRVHQRSGFSFEGRLKDRK